MPSIDPQTVGPKRRILLICLAIFGALAFWSSARRDLWRDEPSHALSILELHAPDSQHGVPLTRLGEALLDTPPLFHYLASISATVFSFATPDEAAPVMYRLPSVLFAILSMWLTYALGRQLFDGRVGFLGMVLQGSTALFFLEASWVSPHLSFIVLCQLTMTGLLLAPETGEAKWKNLTWVGLGGASLCGSPLVAISLVFLPLLVADFFRGGVDSFRERLKIAASGRRWLIAALIALPWYIYVGSTHGEALYAQLITGRYLESASFDDPGFLLPLLSGFMPWTLLLPLGLFHAKDRLSSRGEGICMAWILVAFTTLLVSSWRHPSLLLFIWPPLCLIIPAALYESGERFSVWEGILRRLLPRLIPFVLRAPLVVAVIGGILAWLQWLPESLNSRLAAFLSDSSVAITAWVLAIAAGAGSFYAARKVEKLLVAKESAAAIFEASRAVLFVLLVSGLLLPAINDVASARTFTNKIFELTADAELATYGMDRPWELSYFSGKTVPHFDEISGQNAADEGRGLSTFLDATKGNYLLVPESSLSGLKINSTAIGISIEVTEHGGFMGARGKYELLRSKPKVPPSPNPQNP